ncbi:aminotransferase class I/II-fold pyridoxal phosphate-dependent enzyme [Bacillus benzoevorans]|uniref:Arginine/lysine/ornithine decarboxylase n=1 Tax=Bacillus benzoevorans TaxID=1456 RepID=A0A7X0HX11_9BACI|nr:aminotransferase class I/II-fold pyridoxal phosphate-dependent enzyme [Bacillus benzoevorans]MBB6447497.1 arginine/lysine/ornithine decarboxylase [Bacillus benzoevorans]
MDQYKTPLLDQLILHHKKNPISLHVPGHKYGRLLDHPKYSVYRGILQLDATELAGLDDLHSPEGVIKEAETLLSEIYGTERSYFLVNGSTVGNLAMILTVLQKGDIVLVQRNCHKSVLNGIELAQARPVFLGPEYDEDWGVTGSISEAIVAKAMELYPEAKALILTYPSYYGMVNDLEEIIKQAHKADIPVLVDEAHGAHFICGGFFPKSAVMLGADIVVQSAHKTLPAMTMGSYLHLNGKRIAKGRLDHYLHILQSSSPSYPIMASLDIARSYIGTYSAGDHAYLHEQLTYFAAKLSENDGIKVLNYGSQKGDPLKITLQSQTDLNGFEMQEAFAREGIYTELADPLNVLLVLPLLKTGMDYPFAKVITGINRALQSVKRTKRKIDKSDYHPVISLLEVDSEEAQYLTRRKVSLHDAIGEIAAERVTPYPPGIPLLFPGERITDPVMAQIQHLAKSGARFQEGSGICQGEIYIYQSK